MSIFLKRLILFVPLFMVSIFLLMMLLFCGILFYVFTVPCPEAQIPFDPIKWNDVNADSHQRQKDRHGMLRDLAQNHLRTTMTQDDVKKLLGPPSSDKEHSWSYDGGSTLRCWDGCVLRIYFDDNGFFHEYVIHGH